MEKPDASPAAPALTPGLAGRLAELAAAGVRREFPNAPAHIHTKPGDAPSPRALHPVFYGCFDWHSAVHSHWALARLLRSAAPFPGDGAARATLQEQLTEAGLAAEAAYFEPPHRHGFERPYGWAWALRLAADLRLWAEDDPEAAAWARFLQPLERRLVGLASDFLPRLTHPVRCGTHPETAFALAQFLDYARVVGDKALEKLVAARARDYYLVDTDYPAHYEPSGEDFFSPALNVADFMRRVLPACGGDGAQGAGRQTFADWLTRFLPGFGLGSRGDEEGRPPADNLLQPVEVPSVSDGRLVHLAGLNLSRAWALRGIAGALPPNDPRAAPLCRAADNHARAGLARVFSGDYAGEHWLGSFAVYLLCP